ncbi:MAG: GNAT family N-acetyltransferase [Aquabacterium sp.]
MMSWLKRKLPRFAPSKAVELRRATAEDGRFIFEACLTQAKKGHLNGDFGDPRVQAGLAKQISCAIGDAPVPMPGARDGAATVIWMLTVDGAPVGFTMFLEDRPGSWDKKVELFMVALDEAYHGLGLGRFMVAKLLSGVQTEVMYARCRAPSTRMKAILEREGFKTIGESAAGTAAMELRR